MGADSKGLTVNGAEALHLDLIGLMGGADCDLTWATRSG